MWRKQRFVLAALITVCPLLLLAASSVAAAEPEQCFSASMACIREPFLEYWQQHGAVPILGLPLADAGLEVLEDGQLHLVQYFERARLEVHQDSRSEGQSPRFILLGQFGRHLHPADPPVPARAGATYFDATGHNVAPDLLAFWQAQGGLAQFGYPLSEEITETLEDNKSYTVQYFERARFERHPENAAPFALLLGQFGRYFYGRSLLSPRGTAPDCQPADLGVTMRSGVAAGSTYLLFTLQNQGSSPCHLLGFLRPSLFAADGTESPVIVDNSLALSAPISQSPFVLHPGQAAQGALQWANGCAPGQSIDPAPATQLGITLPSGAGLWRFPSGGPRCGASGMAKVIASHALALSLDGTAGTAYRTIDQYTTSISQGRYRQAFDLFSPELQAQLGPYERFAAGFAGTKQVAYAITEWVPLDDRTVRLSVRLAAWQTDGSVRYFIGSYDVLRLPESTFPDGRIVAANIVEDNP